MGFTKRQFILLAYEEIGLASYAFDLSPEQFQSALWRLDAMIASWNALGIRLGYPLPSAPQNADLDEQTFVPDAANEAIYTNLALRLGPPPGRQVMMETRVTARLAFDALLSKMNAEPLFQQMPSTMPIGAGNKQWGNPTVTFVTPPDDPITTGGEGPLDFY